MGHPRLNLRRLGKVSNDAHKSPNQSIPELIKTFNLATIKRQVS